MHFNRPVLVNKPRVVYVGQSINTSGKLAIYEIRKSNGNVSFEIKIREMIINSNDEFVTRLRLKAPTLEEAIDCCASIIFYNTMPFKVDSDYVQVFLTYISKHLSANIAELLVASSGENADAASHNLAMWIKTVRELTGQSR